MSKERLAFVLCATSLFAALASAHAAHAAPVTQDELRARKLAARRFEGSAVSLPDSALAGGLRVCARETPSGINGYWRVPAKVVDLVDVQLLAHLRKGDIDKRLPFAPKLYVRQYAGFVRDGVRMIYVNALLVEKGSPAAAAAKRSFPASCASVSGSWGIQFDTKTKQFSGFSKN
jgi:hypothetical protein